MIQRVPTSPDERRRIRQQIEALPLDEIPSRNRLETLAKPLVDEEFHLAWTMVLIGSWFWRKRVVAVPYQRRLLLLPHCVRNTEHCPATYNNDGLLCENCGNCELGTWKSLAESLGYHVLIAEGSPVVMQWILAGKADAILGVGCLRSLERAFDKLQLAGIPAIAVPLHAENCKNSVTDSDWVVEMIQTPFEPSPTQKTEPTWIHLLRGAATLCREPEGAPSDISSPVTVTKSLALDFLHRGGKYYRPFITLATYDALTGSHGTQPNGEQYIADLPSWVKNAAMTMEYFHKASLIHDDIEDDDPFRYGKETLHRSHGVPTAINVGDYLIGCGYHLISELRRDVPNEIVAEMFAVLSSAHLKLCEGQGTELAWMQRTERPTPAEVLTFYVGKTSPAFEAALNMGILLVVASKCASGNVDWQFYQSKKGMLNRFAKHLGVAFQIKNDLDDWLPDRLNKRVAGNDALNQRPTLLRALAALDDEQLSAPELFVKYQEIGVFDKARRLITKYADKARESVTMTDHPPFRRLLLHFVETIAE
jgi:geranylgeranyl pyrophosphate synthase